MSLHYEITRSEANGLSAGWLGGLAAVPAVP